MTVPRQFRNIKRRYPALLAAVVVVALLATTLVAVAATQLGVSGWLNHSYAATEEEPNAIEEPTAKGAESKLWWHDGSWWGVLFGPGSNAYTIHRLDPATHDWEDSGVVVDTRINANNRGAQADVLMDNTEGKVYIATHLEQGNPSWNNNLANRAKLKRFSYDAGTTTWSLDSGFEDVTINEDVTRTLVMDRDSTGRLWVTYVSRRGDSPYQVYVNASDPTDPTDWGTPFVLPFAQAVGLNMEDISALAAFTDAGGPKVAVMWSKQAQDPTDPTEITRDFYLAVRPDSAGADPQTGWALEQGLTDLFPPGEAGDDHIKLSPAPGNLLVATVKTNLTGPGDPLVAVVKRAANGDYSLHPVALFSTQDTRPTMAVDVGKNQVHVITVSKEGGGNVCIQSAGLPGLDFGETYNCPPPPDQEPEILAMSLMAATAQVIIGDTTTYTNINDPTTTKQLLTEEMGLAVLASDDVEKVYVHYSEPGTAPPPTETPTVTVTPDPEITPTVTVTPEVTPTPSPEDDYLLYLPLIARE